MALEWKLRNVMASKGVWSGSELGRLMKEKAGYSMTAPSISALLNSNPKAIKADTMDALCTALECTPGDLWKHTPSFIDVNKSVKNNNDIRNVVNENRLPPI